jgi:hypothetical protein
MKVQRNAKLISALHIMKTTACYTSLNVPKNAIEIMALTPIIRYHTIFPALMDESGLIRTVQKQQACYLPLICTKFQNN